MPEFEPSFQIGVIDCIVDFNYRIAIKLDGTRRIRGYQLDNRNLYSKQAKNRFGCKKGVNSWFNRLNGCQSRTNVGRITTNVRRFSFLGNW